MAGLLLLLLGSSPLAEAAERQDWSRVRDLLKAGADPNGAQEDGMTALHWAVQHENAPIARALLDAGAGPGTANRYGVAPLSLACVNGNAALVILLLERGADPNVGGEPPLVTAARTGRLDPVHALLAHGARVDGRDGRGQTPLMWAAAEGHAPVAVALLDAGADVGAKLRSGFTPLLFAARNGRAEVVRVLLKAGADPNGAVAAKAAGRGTPAAGTGALLFAVENGHFEIALELVKAGADPNDRRSRFAPLHALTWVRKANRGDGEDGRPEPAGSGRVGSLEFARELVKLGADVNLPLAAGESGGGKLGMAGATPFLLAARRADTAYLKVLAELGADPMRANKEGSTPLMAAAGLGTLFPTEEAGTEEEAIEAVAYLLEAGADVDAVDENGETAMHGAAYKSLPKMVRFLAGRGARIEAWNRKNRHGWTPLVIAEGFRPGNFKPSVETVEAIHDVMRAAGVVPPPPTPRGEPARQ